MCAPHKTQTSFLFAIAIALVFTFAISLEAQVNQSSISGAVRDASGSMVPGASLELVSSAKGTHRETMTNAEGIYSFPAIPIGTYKLTISSKASPQLKSQKFSCPSVNRERSMSTWKWEIFRALSFTDQDKGW
jgi:hypothetical protein